MRDDAYQCRREGVAEKMQDQNVQSKSAGTHCRVSYVCQDRIGRTGVEEQAKTGEEKKNPGPERGKGNVQDQEKQRESQEHGEDGHQEIRARKPIAKEV